MNERPTPETDNAAWPSNLLQYETVDANFARRLERERDEAREALKHIEEYGTGEINAAVDLRQKLASALVERDEARDSAEQARAYKRVMKEDNAKLRRERDELDMRLIEVSQFGVVAAIEREDLRKELAELKEARK